MELACFATFVASNDTFQIRLTTFLHSTEFLIVVSLVLSLGFSGYLLYCWKRRKIYNGIAPAHGVWIYRDKDPFFYWFYMAFFSFWDAAVIYEFITLMFHRIRSN